MNTPVTEKQNVSNYSILKQQCSTRNLVVQPFLYCWVLQYCFIPKWVFNWSVSKYVETDTVQAFLLLI